MPQTTPIPAFPQTGEGDAGTDGFSRRSSFYQSRVTIARYLEMPEPTALVVGLLINEAVKEIRIFKQINK